MYALRCFKGWFTLWSLLDPQTFESIPRFIFQPLDFSPILNHAFDFLLAEKCFEPPWISDPAKTGPDGPVLLPL